MTTSDRWPLDNLEHLVDALEEQGMASNEAVEMSGTLARLAAWRDPEPSLERRQLLLRQLEATIPEASPARTDRLGNARWLWRLAIHQSRLIYRGLWLGSALGIACVALYAATVSSRQAVDALTLLVPLIVAAGVAFVYGRETDPALELALATPASTRVIVLSRATWIICFDLCLGLLTTALVAALHGEPVWSLASLWFGPTLLLSSASLLLSLLLGAVVAAGSTIAGWCAQLVQIGGETTVHLALGDAWRTTPLTLAAAGLLLVVAIVYAPHQERLG